MYLLLNSFVEIGGIKYVCMLKIYIITDACACYLFMIHVYAGWLKWRPSTMIWQTFPCVRPKDSWRGSLPNSKVARVETCDLKTYLDQLPVSCFARFLHFVSHVLSFSLCLFCPQLVSVVGEFYLTSNN